MNEVLVSFSRQYDTIVFTPFSTGVSSMVKHEMSRRSKIKWSVGDSGQ